MTVTPMNMKKILIQTYRFEEWMGEEINHDGVTGDIQAKLVFGGLVFEVCYDMGGDWSNYKICVDGDVNAETPSVTQLFDCYHTSLNEAVVQAQTNLYNHLLRYTAYVSKGEGGWPA